MNSFATTTSALVSNLVGAGELRLVMPLCRKVMKAELRGRDAIGVGCLVIPGCRVTGVYER